MSCIIGLVKVCVIIPTWNGKDRLGTCLDSLTSQSLKADIVVVDNGSTDGTGEYLGRKHPEARILTNRRNLGFAGGVNTGLRWAQNNDYAYAALLNNDATVSDDWLKKLVAFLDNHSQAGIVASKILDADGQKLDSTGESYTTWGLPFPRGRGEPNSLGYDKELWVFGASGGASLYRMAMFKQIGLFDEDFFAYYEDVDISFRAQLAGWKVGYEPKAIVTHRIGATSQALKGFTTYQTLKNLPQIYFKNMPGRLFWRYLPRYLLAYNLILISAFWRGEIWFTLKGRIVFGLLLPKKLWQRQAIQKSRKVSVAYIDSILVHDLPPNAHKLRSLRAWSQKLRGKNA